MGWNQPTQRRSFDIIWSRVPCTKSFFFQPHPIPRHLMHESFHGHHITGLSAKNCFPSRVVSQSLLLGGEIGQQKCMDCKLFAPLHRVVCRRIFQMNEPLRRGMAQWHPKSEKHEKYNILRIHEYKIPREILNIDISWHNVHVFFQHYMSLMDAVKLFLCVMLCHDRTLHPAGKAAWVCIRGMNEGLSGKLHIFAWSAV